MAITQDEANKIEEETRDQAENNLWMNERRKRITASKVGGIAKMKQSTKRSKKVQDLLYSSFRGNQATHYGSEKEETTRQQYMTHQRRNNHPDLTTEKCGLFISKYDNWLAATPDDIVHDPSNAAHPSGLDKKSFLCQRQEFGRSVCHIKLLFGIGQKEHDKMTKT